MPFKTLGLADGLVQGILATGFSAPTEIQSQAIPVALERKDIIGVAKTGTGKTAAFVLPLLQLLASHKRAHHCRALVLTPTRELAQQIQDAITSYGRFLEFRTLSIYGGVSISNQLRRLHRGVDIVIATPGRLLDHIRRKSVNLSSVEILVLDEADRMFDMGFIHDVKKIVAGIPAQRQTLMFSATIPRRVRELMSAIQKNPVLIEIGEQQSPIESVQQSFVLAPRDQKMNLLVHMLEKKELDSVLVFSRTKRGADRISHRLERGGITSVSIHSDRTQAQRQRALAGFRNGQYRVLVATDVAARGIDVEGISHVINFDIPLFPEDYIHRIGRTGRAAASGDAITFVSREESGEMKKIERFIGMRHELKPYPGFDYQKSGTMEPAHASSPHRSKKRSNQPRKEHSRNRFRKSGRRNRHDSVNETKHAGRATQASDWKKLVAEMNQRATKRKRT